MTELNASGGPLYKVLILKRLLPLNRAVDSQVCRCDFAGRFSIKDVIVGNVPVRATLEGYFAAPVNGQSSDRSKVTAVPE